MADWSVERHYFGRTNQRVEQRDFRSAQQHVIRAIEWDTSEETLSSWCSIHRVSRLGPAILLEGEGRYGAPMPLSQRSRSKLRSGIEVYQSSIYEDLTRRIWVAGEVVFEREWRDLDPFVPAPAWDYEGNTPGEQVFFSELWRAISTKPKERGIQLLRGNFLGEDAGDRERAVWG